MAAHASADAAFLAEVLLCDGRPPFYDSLPALRPIFAATPVFYFDFEYYEAATPFCRRRYLMQPTPALCFATTIRARYAPHLRSRLPHWRPTFTASANQAT